jgi:hypothetical protein
VFTGGLGHCAAILALPCNVCMEIGHLFFENLFETAGNVA